jgi:uncharacterized protein (TIRG00374 family)
MGWRVTYAFGMDGHATGIRRTLFAAAKIALAAALLAYLLNQAWANDAFTQLLEKPKRWPLLIAGLACQFVSAALSFVRWHLFIRAVGISARLLDTLRLGALGYALNFVSLGSIGGDLFKAIFLAHGQPGRRTEAVASVVADRILGLLTILILASIGILVADIRDGAAPALAVLCDTILVATILLSVFTGLALTVPGLSGPQATAWANAIPLLGPTLARLLGAVRSYRYEKQILLWAAIISVAGNVANFTAFYLVASGLPISRPSYLEHFVVVPVANMVGAIPATPNGLGTKEAAADLLYRTVPSGSHIAEGVGTMATLAHRATELCVAMLGLAYYLGHRREVSEVYAEAEEIAASG